MVKLRKYILNYFDFEQRYTNAAAEGVNSKIKKINSEGRGYPRTILNNPQELSGKIA